MRLFDRRDIMLALAGAIGISDWLERRYSPGRRNRERY
jgi:hypothetical protein